MNKINKVIPYKSTNTLTELNQLLYAGVKLVCEKIGIHSKNTKKKSKPGCEIRLEIQIKNLRKQVKMIKQMERCLNMLEQNGKGNTRNNNNATWGNNPESTGERWKIKEISTKGKTIQTKQNIVKRRRTILSTAGGRWHENIPTTRCKRNWTIWTKIWQPPPPKEKQRKGRKDKLYDKRIRRAQRRPQSGNTHWFTQNDTKKYQTGKRLAMMEYVVSGSRNSPPFTTDKHKKWTKSTHPNGWPKKRPQCYKRTKTKELP